MKEQGILTASGLVDWKLKSGQLKMPIKPKSVIFCPEPVLRANSNWFSRRQVRGLMGTHVCVNKHSGIYLSSGWGMGASALVALCEEWRALGVTHFLHLGFVGRLTSKLDSSEVIIGHSALSEEGCSRHYSLGDNNEIKKHTWDQLESLMNGIDHLSQQFVSTDAPFRETPDMKEKWISKKATVVDMETSGLYAFAHYYNLKALSVGISADLLEKDVWTPPEDTRELNQTLFRTSRILISNLAR
ncbi:hypothetical protein [Marinoscillum sp. MHG1-6]|uniref:phosphorylase family protein n=1 Tax=Marinoscillum sp. MHG1-6 TaxID=2959627 RepID=UPI002157014A|nr:hypothetical protein [Marinoscillum sp. MHG1-6]